ncbi:ABC transporter permease [Flindersiella endophytica]
MSTQDSGPAHAGRTNERTGQPTRATSASAQSEMTGSSVRAAADRAEAAAERAETAAARAETASSGGEATPVSAPAEPGHRRPPTTLIGIIVVPLLVAVALTLFAWPAANLEPRNLPIGIAGPAQAVGSVEQGLTAKAGSDAFDVHTYPDEAAARSAIQDREIYGAISVGPSGVTLLTASAASPVVAQLLQQAGTQLAAANPSAPAPKVVDVVPTDPDDPRGVVLGAALFPLLLAGLVGAFMLGTRTRPGLGQAGALIAIAGLAGLVVIGIAQGWLGAFGGDWWVNAGAFALTILAIAAGVAGLGAVFGLPGLLAGAALMALVGNPFSGLTSAPEMLPTWVGVTGQYLPPGAGGTLVRSTAFFDGAGADRPLLVLACWALAGLALVVVGRWVRPSQRANPA